MSDKPQPKTETKIELRAWEEARIAAMRKHLVQVEQSDPPAK